MAKIKIGEKEYTIPRLNNKDVKNMERYRKEKELDMLDFDTYMLLYTLKKADPECKLTIDELDTLLDIGIIDNVRKTINDNSGLTKYVEKAKDANLTPGIGKAQ